METTPGTYQSARPLALSCLAHTSSPYPPYRSLVAELIALRNFQKKPTGIELDKLNRGLKKKRKKRKDSVPQSAEERWMEQMEDCLVKRENPTYNCAPRGASYGDDEDEDGDEESGGNHDGPSSNKSRNKLARKDNFQGETNAIDVDKHMMAYIEEEMKKRKTVSDGDVPSASSESVQVVLSNPEDEIYKVAEKYARLQQEARTAAQAKKLISKRSRPDDEEGEGNVGLSSAMLSGIPEVELGMDSRLKNIEDTEKAKRALFEARHQAKRSQEDDLLANARFFRPKQQAQSDAQALAVARAAATGQLESFAPNRVASKRSHSERKEMASDEVVMQRFKNRQLNQMKR